MQSSAIHRVANVTGQGLPKRHGLHHSLYGKVPGRLIYSHDSGERHGAAAERRQPPSVLHTATGGRPDLRETL